MGEKAARRYRRQDVAKYVRDGFFVLSNIFKWISINFLLLITKHVFFTSIYALIFTFYLISIVFEAFLT